MNPLARFEVIAAFVLDALLPLLEMTLRGVAIEHHNLAVLLFKVAIWCTCVASLALSYRRACR